MSLRTSPLSYQSIHPNISTNLPSIHSLICQPIYMCTAQSSAQHSIRLIHQPIIHFSIIDLFQQFIHPPIFQSVIHPSSNPSSAHPPIHRPPILQTHHQRILQPIIHPSSNPSSNHPSTHPALGQLIHLSHYPSDYPSIYSSTIHLIANYFRLSNPPYIQAF